MHPERRQLRCGYDTVAISRLSRYGRGGVQLCDEGPGKPKPPGVVDGKELPSLCGMYPAISKTAGRKNSDTPSTISEYAVVHIHCGHPLYMLFAISLCVRS